MRATGTGATVALVATPADAPRAVALIRELDADIVERDPEGPIYGLHPGEHRDPRLRFFVLTVAGKPAGCGAIRELEPGPRSSSACSCGGPSAGRGSPAC